MKYHFPIVNAFIEDTCVIAVIAYLLARGRMLMLLFGDKPTQSRSIAMGLVFGLIGLSEIVFPGDRSPYVVHTLLVSFATIVGGFSVGLAAASTITVGSLFLRSLTNPVHIALMLAAAAVLAEGVRLVISERHSLLRACIAGALAQACVVAARYEYHVWTMAAQAPLSVLMKSVPANGFGALLLQLILNEARTRAEGEKHRLDAERSQAMVAEAQLMSLRARVHPHFLFNTLTSIAALCSIAPERAADAIVRLSQLMRRVLEAAPTTLQSLGDELEYVRSYLEIEQHRLGDRLQVVWEIQPGTDCLKVPPFSVQILVENSINHGICPRMEPGTIRIVVRTHGSHVIVAVADDGAGMDSIARRRALDTRDSREHGLQTLTQQLVLIYGESSRIRVFSRPDRGTIACFSLPSANTVGSSNDRIELLDEQIPQRSIA